MEGSGGMRHWIKTKTACWLLFDKKIPMQFVIIGKATAMVKYVDQLNFKES